jgi:hypothetical protein
MKSIVSLVAFAGVSLAQNSIIGLPTAGQNLSKGSNVVIQIKRPVCCLLYRLKLQSLTILTC